MAQTQRQHLPTPVTLHLLIGLCVVVTGVVTGVGGDEEALCVRGELALYEMNLVTAWDRRVFPKQYPEWRPPAQWSKVLGRSHDASYTLFRISESVRDGVKEFAELAQSDLLDGETQQRSGLLDQFIAPPVPEGVGESSARFFVDANHSRVSLISRIIPSPDWFIGVDNFDLCMEGKWMDSVVLEVDPLDAGTDNGFTFTSPNWPTIPRKPVTRITAQNPNHPANSFFYPDTETHPPIATIRLSKIKEYNLAREYTPSQSASVRYSSDDLARHKPRPQSSGTRGLNDTQVETVAEENGNHDSTASDIGGSDIGITGNNAEPGERGIKTLLNAIVNKYKKKYRKNRRGRKTGQGRKGGSRRRRVGMHRHMKTPRDCRVSDWSSWSSCSKTCGIGEQVRTRTVVRQSRRGGRHCSPLEETTWCGSYRDCDLPHFQW